MISILRTSCTQTQASLAQQLLISSLLVIYLSLTCQATTTTTTTTNQKLTSAVYKQDLVSINQKLPTNSSYLNNFNLNLASDDESSAASDDQDGLYLLGLFDVHAAASGGSRRAPFKCGPIDTDAGETSSRRPMQNMWAFLWAIEQVNADETLLPGVKLGSLVLDTCSSFLRTNQQLANLLHRDHDHHTSGETPNKLPRTRQFLGVVADQHDWQSVEATASMASSLGLTTYVTQSRSTKLSEFARSFLGHNHLSSELPSGEPTAGKPLAQVPSDERLLRELLGIGRMLPVDPDISPMSQVDNEEHKSNRLLMIRMAQNNEMIADALASLCERMKWDLVSVIYDGAARDSVDLVDLHDELIRQLLLRNIQLALDKQITSGGGAAAAAARPAATMSAANSDNYERLLVNLARQAQIGSRVVISLLSIGSARQLQARLHQMRKQIGASSSQQQQREQLKALNSLLWITTADREPYYTYATDSLGVISASSSSSLLPEFKQFYDQTLNLGGVGGVAANSTHPRLPPPQNRWWPEYVRAIMQRHKRELGELLVNECAHWQEPRASPLQAKCAQLNLSSLVQTERSQNQKLARRLGSVDQPAGMKLSTTTGNSNRLSLQRYLASGWEHNGMEVINSVLALANGLESLRQSLCPETQRGLCPRMRDLVRQEQVAVLPASAATAEPRVVHDEDQPDQSVSSIKESGSGPMGEQLVELPTLSELIHSELIRSTFQLADGQMFSLADSAGAGGGGGFGGDEPVSAAAQTSPVASAVASNTQTQLDARLKFYNLRFLRPNSIGFVKFAQFGGSPGSFGSSGGLTLLNATRALHYTNIPMDFNELQPIERVQSTCQDERKCLMLSSILGSSVNEHQQQQQVVANGQVPKSDLRRLDNSNQRSKLAISEEELAQGVNSLFKLDHPLISSSSSSLAESSSSGSGAETNSRSRSPGGLAIRTMRPIKPVVAALAGLRNPFAGDSQDQTGGLPPMSAQPASERKRQFEVIVLLPLRSGKANIGAGKLPSTGAWRASCPSGPGEEARSFQHLAALAYAQARAQQLVDSQQQQQRAVATQDDNKSTSGGGDDGQRQQVAASPSFELTISVIDYCDQVTAAEIGDDNLIEQQVARLLAGKLSATNSGQVRDNSSGNNNNSATQLVAIVDFDWRVSQQVEAIVGELTSSSSSSPSSSQSAELDNFLTQPPVHLTIDHRAHHHGTSTLASARRAGKGRAAGGAFRINLLPNKQREIGAMISLIKSSFPNWRLLHLIYAHDQREFRDEFIRQANEANICVSKLISIPSANELEAQTLLEGTRELFRRELYNFSTTSTKVHDGEPANGLVNSTRLLVVLASESAATNRHVLQAASESMLRDYVWLTTHEWLASVELPAERTSGATPTRWPRLFLSTKLESFEGHDFRLFFNHLTPALHAQLPTDWFDRFWQDHFQCSLSLKLASGGLSIAPRPPPCDTRQQLELDDNDGDQRALYTMRAIEAIHLALSRSLQEPRRQAFNLARNFRLAFDSGPEAVGPAGTPTRDDLDPATPLVGFHIVHRLVPQQQFLAARRANSRQLDSMGQLVRVGATSKWQKSRLTLAPFGKRKRTSSGRDLSPSRLQALLVDRPPIDTNSTGDTIEPVDQDQQQELARISESLEYLASVKSRCVSNRTCSLCRQQVSSARELRRQEEARMRLESSEARAISPLHWSTSAAATSNIESEDADEEAEEEEDDKIERNRKSESLDDIQAAASSLFSSRTSQQVASEIRHDYHARWHSAGREQQRRLATGGSSSSHYLLPAGGQQPLRRLSGALLSVLSLVGVVFTVASMTYFYPNLLDRQHKHLLGGGGGKGGRQSERLQSSFRSTSSSTCNIITADGGARSLSSSSSLTGSGNSHSHLNSILANLTDYLMLTGLLMLYSINIAFLLPATMSVCWFRRIGLALSYTLLFSSILAKIHEVHARQPRTSKRRACDPRGSQDLLVARQVSKPAVNRSHQSLESVDESVEVTFESLPHESESAYQAEQQQQLQSAGAMVQQRHLAGVNHNDADALSYLDRDQTAPPSECAGDAHDELGTTDYFRVPLALILVQVIVALTWLIKQPPEPTLFHSCWHCASLMRSPVLFLYEPLMSLLEPAAILVVSWLWSIAMFNRAFSQERQFSLASREFISSQPLSFALTNSPEYLRHKQLKATLTCQLRDSKLLVITTTLLVLLWSAMTLNIIASSQALLGTLTHGNGGFSTSAGGAISRPSAAHLDDQSLLYTNLISGALVFALLFVYRLRLFRTGSGGSLKALNKCDYDQISSSSGMGGVAQGKRRRSSIQSISRRLKSMGRSRRFSTTTMTAGDGAGRQFDETLPGRNHLSGSNKNNQQAERLKLQQFNMTYGTYSPTATAADVAPSFGPSTSGAHLVLDQQVVAWAGPPEVVATSPTNGVDKKRKRDKAKDQSDSRSGSSRSLFKLTAGGRRPMGDKNKSERDAAAGEMGKSARKTNKKLQQQVGVFSTSRQSLNGSLSLADDGDSDLELELPLDDHLMMRRGGRRLAGDQDTLSCASNATSQLQGNDLYPIDCSIQLVDNLGPPVAGRPLARDKQPAAETEAEVASEHF